MPELVTAGNILAGSDNGDSRHGGRVPPSISAAAIVRVALGAATAGPTSTGWATPWAPGRHDCRPARIAPDRATRLDYDGNYEYD